MKYITDNDTLKHYIPNVFAEVEGEDSLFTKLKPHIRQAEAWMEYRIIRPAALVLPEEGSGSGSGSGEGEGENLALELARQIVAAEAFRMAVPSLDLILTPNGFGIVSNNTVAPASKERVASLVEGLIEMRDAAIEQLAASLSGSSHILGGRIFAGFDLQRALGFSDHLLQHFLEDRQKEHAAVLYVAERAVSQHLMDELKQLPYSAVTASDAHLAFLHKVQAAVIAQMNGTLDRPLLADIVEIIRSNAVLFHSWEDSEAAVYWSDRTFKNDKSSGGIWL